MNLEYFDLYEFDSPDLPGSGRRMMDMEFMSLIDDARGIAGIPFRITSGYRTPSHNRIVGGVDDSSHVKGCAADIYVPDNRHRWLILDALIKVGFNRIGIANSFIHVDNDAEKTQNVIWTY
jgi:uncharacterized protein YcbK (DUF882 family)